MNSKNSLLLNCYSKFFQTHRFHCFTENTATHSSVYVLKCETKIPGHNMFEIKTLSELCVQFALWKSHYSSLCLMALLHCDDDKQGMNNMVAHSLETRRNSPLSFILTGQPGAN